MGCTIKWNRISTRQEEQDTMINQNTIIIAVIIGIVLFSMMSKPEPTTIRTLGAEQFLESCDDTGGEKIIGEGRVICLCPTKIVNLGEPFEGC